MRTTPTNAAAVHIQRNPELGFGREVKSRRHYTNDAVFLSVEFNLGAHKLGISAEMALPEAVAENGFTISSRLILAGEPGSAQKGTGTQQREKVGFRGGTNDVDRFAPTAQVHRVRPAH